MVESASTTLQSQPSGLSHSKDSRKKLRWWGCTHHGQKPRSRTVPTLQSTLRVTLPKLHRSSGILTVTSIPQAHPPPTFSDVLGLPHPPLDNEIVSGGSRLKLTTKLKVFTTCVLLVLLFGSETWTLRADDTGRLQAFSLRCQLHH